MTTATTGTTADGSRLAAKLAKITDAIGSVEAKGFHDFLKTKYVTEEDVMTAVREQLSAESVFLSQSITNVDTRPVEIKTKAGVKNSIVTSVVMDMTFIDGDTGERLTAGWVGVGEDPTDKGVSKALTSGLRYFLLKTFLVTSSEPPAAGERVHRADGAIGLTPEQYQGIVDAYQRAGSDETMFAVILDSVKVPTVDAAAEPLNIAQRVQLLTSTAANVVMKKLTEQEVKS